MTGIFKNNNPAGIIFLFIYGLLLKLPYFLHPVIPQPQIIDGFLYKAFLKWAAQPLADTPYLYSMLAYAFLFTQALGINYFVNKQKLFQKPGYIAAMSYLLITSFFPEWNMVSSILFVNTALIWILNLLLNLHDAKSSNASLLNIGIILGVGSFIYFPSVSFMLLVFMVLAITRRFNAREWLMVVLGVMAPFYFLFAWAFLAGKWKNYSFPGIGFHIPGFDNTATALTGIIILGVFFLWGLYLVQKNFMRLLIQTRKSWNVIYLYLLVATVIPFINTNKGFSYWLLAAPPLAIVMGGCFVFPGKKWVSPVIHWILAGYILATQYFIR